MSIFQNHLLRTVLIVIAGVALIGVSVYNISEQLRTEMSPLDMVDPSPIGGQSVASPTARPTATPVSENDAQLGLAEENAITVGVSSEDVPDFATPSGAESAAGYPPDRIVIEKINLDAPIVPVSIKEVKFEGKVYQQWLAPNAYEVGWHNTSAPLGVPGNTVLNGHHNVYGEVFGKLVRMREGDVIKLYSGDKEFIYRVALVMLLPEKYKTVEDRMENARWILPSDDERITLITCWPKASNTHRVVVVAIPDWHSP